MTTYVLHIASGLYFRISASLSLSILDSKTVHEWWKKSCRNKENKTWNQTLKLTGNHSWMKALNIKKIGSFCRLSTRFGVEYRQWNYNIVDRTSNRQVSSLWKKNRLPGPAATYFWDYFYLMTNNGMLGIEILLILWFCTGKITDATHVSWSNQALTLGHWPLPVALVTLSGHQLQAGTFHTWALAVIATFATRTF